jgi:hypothetical protein
VDKTNHFGRQVQLRAVRGRSPVGLAGLAPNRANEPFRALRFDLVGSNDSFASLASTNSEWACRTS